MDNFDCTNRRMSWKEFVDKNDFSLRALIKFNNSRILNKGLFKDLTFIYRVLLNRKDFFGFLEELKKPQFYPLAEKDDSILFKILRPYELSRYSVKERIEAITKHYEILNQYLPSDKLNQLYTEEGIEIGRYTPTEAIPLQYRIIAHFSKTHRREGDFAISIVRESIIEGFDVATTERIFSIAFNLGYINGQRVMKINAIQGCTPHLAEPQKEISNITKLGFGLLPKYILVAIAFKMSVLFDCEEVLAIKKNSHVFNNVHYKTKMKNEFKNDYDKQWQDFNPVDFDNDYYKITPMPRTPIEEIPSKKRSQHRKRYNFVDQIINNLETIFSISKP